MEPVELEKHSSTGSDSDSDSDSERLHYATVGGAGAPEPSKRGLNLMRSRREDAPNSKFESRPSKHVAHDPWMIPLIILFGYSLPFPVRSPYVRCGAGTCPATHRRGVGPPPPI